MSASTELHRFQDLWHGFVMDLPPGWQTRVDKEGRILAGAGGDEGVLLCPLSTPPGVEPGALVQEVARGLANGDPRFQAWEAQNRPNEAAFFFSRPAPTGGGEVRGLIRVHQVPQGGALAMGYQARAERLGERRELLERVLASFQYVPPLPRTSFVDPSEHAFGLQVPQGWVAQGGVDRRRNAKGEGAVVWVVDDPRTHSRVAQESLVIDMVASPAVSAVSGFFGQIGQAFGMGQQGTGLGYSGGPGPSGYQFAGLPCHLFTGQHSWKARPYLDVTEYCRQVLVPMAQPMRPDLKLETVVLEPALDELARQSLRPVEMQMGGPCAITTGVAVCSYSENGVKFRECTILVNWMPPNRQDPFSMMMGAALSYWFCSMGPIWRAPEHLFEEMNPILKGISSSYQVNQAWEGRETSSIVQHMNEERIQAESYRANKLRETMDYIHKVEREIVEHRQATQAEINRGQYNLIAGKEDVADGSGSSWKVDSGWDTYWRKDGDIVGSRSGDLDTHLEANGWKRLKVF